MNVVRADDVGVLWLLIERVYVCISIASERRNLSCILNLNLLCQCQIEREREKCSCCLRAFIARERERAERGNVIIRLSSVL